MVQKTLGIYTHKNEACRFYIEIGGGHVACWTLSVDYGAWNAFEFFEFSAAVEEKSFADIFNEIRSNSVLIPASFDSTTVIWENPDALFIPEAFYAEEMQHDYLTTVIGSTGDYSSHTCLVNNKKLLYAVPNKRMLVVNQFFPQAKHQHKYALLANTLLKEAEAAGNFYMKVIFYEAHFLLLVTEQNRLLLLQYFTYTVPGDVVYHLLNVAKALDFSIHKTKLTVSGFIDTASELYLELNKYIRYLNVETVPNSLFNNEALNEKKPPHYFIPFFNHVV